MILEQRLRGVRESGRKVLAPYLTAGFPSPDVFGDLVAAIVDAGADLLEIGIPFTDPIMDGPVIQEASVRALAMEMRPATAIRSMSALRCPVPFVYMTYANPCVQLGWKDFAAAAAESGASGAIIPDLPPEESADWVSAAAAQDLAPVFLVAPTTPPERVEWIARIGGGFVYCVSLLGVTGVRAGLSEMAEPLVRLVRESTDRPALVGIGVSTPEQAVEACRFADGVIVGSAIIKRLLEAPARDGIAAAASLVRSMRGALDGG